MYSLGFFDVYFKHALTPKRLCLNGESLLELIFHSRPTRYVTWLINWISQVLVWKVAASSHALAKVCWRPQSASVWSVASVCVCVCGGGGGGDPDMHCRLASLLPWDQPRHDPSQSLLIGGGREWLSHRNPELGGLWKSANGPLNVLVLSLWWLRAAPPHRGLAW